MSDIPKILIIGNSQAGKSTLAKMIGDHFSCSFMGTSRAIYDKLIADCVSVCTNIVYHKCMYRLKLSPKYGDLFRKFLFDAGNRMREDDPAALVKICLSYTNIVEGVRTKEEFQACKQLFDSVIWVDRPSTEPNETDELREEDADTVFDNTGTLEDLQQLVKDRFA